jgi:hypothetical protein
MRNQKFHEQEECAKFIREDYEQKEQEKIKELEEEERRKQRVAEMQKKRRQVKEDKERKEKEENERLRARARPKATGVGGAKPASKPSNKGRALPDYYSKASKPSGVAGRTRAKRSDPAPVSKPTSSYQPKLRQNRAKWGDREEHKEVKKPAAVSKSKNESNKYSSYSQDVPMADAGVMDEIPAELLNQIYSEDLDHVDANKIQENMYLDPKPAENKPIGERLVDFENRHFEAPPPRVEPRRASPPPREDMPMPGPSEPQETEQDMIQKAIAESLRNNNPRNHPMRKFLVDFL